MKRSHWITVVVCASLFIQCILCTCIVGVFYSNLPEPEPIKQPQLVKQPEPIKQPQSQKEKLWTEVGQEDHLWQYPRTGCQCPIISGDCECHYGEKCICKK